MGRKARRVTRKVPEVLQLDAASCLTKYLSNQTELKAIINDPRQFKLQYATYFSTYADPAGQASALQAEAVEEIRLNLEASLKARQAGKIDWAQLPETILRMRRELRKQMSPVRNGNKSGGHLSCAVKEVNAKRQILRALLRGLRGDIDGALSGPGVLVPP